VANTAWFVLQKQQCKLNDGTYGHNTSVKESENEI